MEKNLSMQDFLSGAASNVMNFDKKQFQESIDADTVGVYFSKKSDRWYISLSNSETGKSYKPIGLDESLKPNKAQQSAIDAGNAAKAVLDVNPKDKKALKAVEDATEVVVEYALGLLDDAGNFIYAGESDNGKWLRLSPNAPGVLNVQTYSMVTA